LLDDFSIQQRTIVQKRIGQGPLLLRVVLVASCGVGWSSSSRTRLPSTMWRVNSLASLPNRFDANEPHALTASKQQCLAINNPLHNLKFKSEFLCKPESGPKWRFWLWLSCIESLPTVRSKRCLIGV
jgi:hypothetical protein